MKYIDNVSKIFISRRLDIKSLYIDNPIYVQVLCGAVYNDLNTKYKFYGDNTGDNISERRNSFCEFTVQYWAWKNQKSDYYGLCHYRRYLSFSDKIFKANNQEQILEGFLDSAAINKYELSNYHLMNRIISEYDLVVNKAAEVSKIPTPIGKVNTVWEHWEAHDGVFIDRRVLPMLVATIKELYPQYGVATDEYLNGSRHRGYNCYVMRRELFNQMCEFQFGVLFAMEDKLQHTGYTKGLERTLGYLGEIMYGIYVYYLQQQGKYKIKELQLVYFEQTELPDSRLAYWLQKILYKMKFQFEDIGYVLLPKGSPRRNFVKKIYFALTGKNKNK